MEATSHNNQLRTPCNEQPLVTTLPIVNSSRRNFITAGVAATLGCCLPNLSEASVLAYNSPEIKRFDTLGASLGDFALEELGFSAGFRLVKWVESKLNSFENGSLKIQGCSSMNAASDYLFEAVSAAAKGFSALANLYRERELGEIGDLEWEGPISKSATELRTAYRAFQNTDSLDSSSLQQVIDASAPLIAKAEEIKNQGNNALIATATLLVITGVVRLWNKIKSTQDSREVKRDRIHNTPGIL